MTTLVPAPSSAHRHTTDEWTGRAMGSSAQILLSAPAPRVHAILGSCWALVDSLERRWSRFEATSEISMLNRSEACRAHTVTAETALLIHKGVEGWHLTDGRFDPTVLEALIDAGYDRPLEQLTGAQNSSRKPAQTATAHAAAAEVGNCGSIRATAGTVTMPRGVAFDPGGLGKGLAADLVAAHALNQGASGVLVNLGGDIRCAGQAPGRVSPDGPTDDGWPIGLPELGPGAMLRIGAGGVATSSCRKRAWRGPDGPAHHLINPRSRRPSPAAARSVTVVAATACDAEILATAVAAEGRLPRDRSILGGAVVLLIDATGGLHTHGPIDRYVAWGGGSVNEQFWWLLARSGGIVALALVAASVVWGLLVSSKYLQGGAKPRNLVSVHRFLGAMSVVFTGIHLAALWLDSWIQFTLADLLIPFAADWRPVPVALGVIGFWLLVAVQGSSLLMRRLPRRLWKWVHLTSFALLPLGLLHGITAGTDAHTVWYRLSTAGAIGLVTWLTVWRAWLVPGRRRRQPGLAPAGAAAARGGHDQRIQPLG